ncbi:hypothetical protein LOTGIDRAFT_180090 [Lottia gigantea]|uniref:Enhancer of mRNA-decapping protein 3 n=1 Tax=Lottia gigantea TaxID=225164 RepID=V4BC08_LOTGI|nr:hypothetical protein LOTGIDRAFT_180090 [Lottia gigantea]ESP03622.1 hypothetical protein LOTGIDRAFT_180090 [Lottia gigantea]
MSDWVGSIVSLDCGDVLGTYQGQVQWIDNGDNTLTLRNAFRNGLKCEVPNVTIRSSDIRELKILNSPEDAKDVFCRKATPSKLSKEVEESINPKCPSPVKVIHASGMATNGFIQGSNPPMNNMYSGSYTKRATPTRDYGLANQNGQYSNGQYNNGHYLTNGYNNKQNGNQRLTPTRDPDVRRQNDFDFEKNLQLFDKQAEYAKIENDMPEGMMVDKKPTKYRCDENVLSTGPVVLQQIKTPGTAGRSYVTDSGLVVPCISTGLRNTILSLAVKYGITIDRQIEMVGRSASEMVLQLLGGCHRLSPQNGHQLPVVVILCGPHLQGAKGINCARQLANHNVKTLLYVPNFVRMPEEIEKELKLYELCDGKRTSCAKDLPQGPVDMIVNALDNHDNLQLRHQDWYTSLVNWAGNKRANCLTIDPPIEGSLLESKWSLAVCLPLEMKACNSQMYLCDLGIPKKVYSEAGIKYMSPFGHKFVIPLHERT